MHGVLNIAKPIGPTSHDVVARVRRIAGQKRVGHAGTLDPGAAGVLLVCLGHATRLADLLADQGKSYAATMALGTTTTTEDAEGDEIAVVDASTICESDLLAVVGQFVGKFMQTPPMVSAVHHEGRRLYQFARQGVDVYREAREVHVSSIELAAWRPGARAQADLVVQCGKGTYIRTLCADIGASLGVGAHMASLTRLSVGAFALEDAVALEELSAENIASFLHSPSDSVAFLPLLEVDEGRIKDVFNGKTIVAGAAQGYAEGCLVRLVTQDGELIGLGEVITTGGAVHPDKVFTRHT